jgi:catechol 2,3-dioxygenase-like lactoylglutathione lyase family enzyme
MPVERKVSTATDDGTASFRAGTLTSPTHAVVGSHDVEATVKFFTCLGFEPATRRPIPSEAASALYGLESATEEVELTAGGSLRGAICIVGTPRRATPCGPFDVGGYDLSLYTTDLDRSAEVAARAGAHVGPVAVLKLGPVVMRQQQAIGPEGIRIVFIQSSHRRPSILDDDPKRVHSEVHSIVWCVESIERAAPFWRRAGLAQAFDAPIADPAVSTLLELSRPLVPIRMSLFSDDSLSPSRFELLEFPEDGLSRPREGVPPPGIWALGFGVPDVASAISALQGGSFGEAVFLEPARRAATGEAPGGVRFELREAAGR